MRTTEERKHLHEKLWQWLADNPEENKTDWPEWLLNEGEYDTEGECFACEEAREKALLSSRRKYTCFYCPCEWGACSCEDKESPYHMWKWATNAKDRRKYALQVKDAWK